MSKVEVLRRLHKDFSLDKTDFFTSKQGFTIIVRSGIEKIQYKLGLKVQFDIISCEKDFCCVKATGSAPNKIPIETFGSAIHSEYIDIKKKNKAGKEYLTKELKGSTNSYYVMEIAEKRALARVTIKMADLYQFNVFSEDEAPQEMGAAQESVSNKSSSAVAQVF